MSELKRDCPTCLTARDALVSLKNALSSSYLYLGGTPLSHGSDGKKEKLIKSSLQIDCRHCGNKLSVLTEEGKQLLEMLLHEMQNGGEKIPF